MSKKEEKKEVLTGPHLAEQERVEEQAKQEDEDLKELDKAIDVAGDLLSWTKTPAGKDTVDRLHNESYKAMNELFAILHESPELGKLISAVARFESAIQMLRRFTGAENDLDALLTEYKRKRPSSAADAVS